jgi:hypothetical protein
MKTTRKAYEKYLNSLALDNADGKYIIGGRLRIEAFSLNYGTAIRKHDPIAFEVGYNEWKLNQHG